MPLQPPQGNLDLDALSTAITAFANKTYAALRTQQRQHNELRLAWHNVHVSVARTQNKTYLLHACTPTEMALSQCS